MQHDTVTIEDFARLSTDVLRRFYGLARHALGFRVARSRLETIAREAMADGGGPAAAAAAVAREVDSYRHPDSIYPLEVSSRELLEHALADDLEASGVLERPAEDPTEVPQGALARVCEMMAMAAEAQKRAPKIELRTTDGRRVVLRRAGESSSRPGTVHVTDGRPFGESTWFGRIDPATGSFFASRQADAGVRSILVALAADPAAVAGQHGIATGECCFCARALSTRESRSVGYGPICAERYGLPWGDTTAADALDAEARAAGARLAPDVSS